MHSIVYVPRVNVWPETIHKRCSQKYIYIDICQKTLTLKTIGLLLQMHKTRCIFHNYSSSVKKNKN